MTYNYDSIVWSKVLLNTAHKCAASLIWLKASCVPHNSLPCDAELCDWSSLLFSSTASFSLVISCWLTVNWYSAFSRKASLCSNCDCSLANRLCRSDICTHEKYVIFPLRHRVPTHFLAVLLCAICEIGFQLHHLLPKLPEISAIGSIFGKIIIIIWQTIFVGCAHLPCCCHAGNRHKSAHARMRRSNFWPGTHIQTPLRCKVTSHKPKFSTTLLLTMRGLPGPIKSFGSSKNSVVWCAHCLLWTAGILNIDIIWKRSYIDKCRSQTDLLLLRYYPSTGSPDCTQISNCSSGGEPNSMPSNDPRFPSNDSSLMKLGVIE